MRERFRLLVAAVAWVSTAACTSVLGLDAPTLDPCAEQPCVDATGEAAAEATLPEAGGEAACVWDGGVAFVDGAVRCGGGCFAEVSCSGATPVCCLTQAGSGAVSYGCVASESACSGYAIDCVNENDCNGTDVCCHYTSHTVCAASCTSGADITCLPGSTDDCPAGKKCSVAVTDGDAAAPYYTCQP
ncbi:MAG TPA: hypothetical protein VIF09_17915 [Polyangiaceae bacterium]